jgi:hypothetical protein
MTRARDMANLGSQAGSGLDASDITSGVLPSGVTGGSGLTALGTITAGNLSNSAIVMPRIKEFSSEYYSAQTTSTIASQNSINIFGAKYVSATIEHVNDLLNFEWNMGLYAGEGYMGWGIQRATNTGFSAGVATQWSTGQHRYGVTKKYGNGDGNITLPATGLSAGTTYYFRMFGMNHSGTNDVRWGMDGDTATNAVGVYMALKRWSIV